MENEFRRRCYQCFRPLPLCYCPQIPRIDNRTEVLILQHVRERFHPFNTARIVNAALQRCSLVVDDNRHFATQQLPIREGAGLLYPRPGAPVLTDLAVEERPDQLIIIDGTWHQAKTIVRDVPQLGRLPCYQLAPTAPGQYRIRREPNERSLSTVEAAVAALRSLEPDTAGLDELLSVFSQMVERQLVYPTSRGVWRHNHRRNSRPRDVPRALLQDPSNLVVAYGEATPGRLVPSPPPTPITWHAARFGTGEQFGCLLAQRHPIPDEALTHMRLSADDFVTAASEAEFRGRWEQFLRPRDVLVVYHQRTFELLRNVGAAVPRCLVLKSIFGKLNSNFSSLEELVAREVQSPPGDSGESRSACRLLMATTLVEELRRRADEFVDRMAVDPSSAKP